ncbi:hypothetical protein JTB14_015887 [Gonioctena quinquepunctata]|nr:hypothetical protein JTB14_015887 [Gonioctena quinquepunctata]
MEDRVSILKQMKICRFCLSEDVELSGIHDKHVSESDSKTVPLPLQIMACIAIEVFKNDGMPQLICSNCRNLTLQAYNFKTNCKKADDALRLFLATGQLSKPHIVNKQSTLQVVSQPKLKPADVKEKVQVVECTGERRESTEDLMQDYFDDEELEGVRSIEGDHESENTEEGGKSRSAEKRVKTDCFPCPHCERSFPLKQLLDLHVSNHGRERNFTCTECDRKFYTKYDLQKHQTTHDSVDTYPCVVCKKSFSRHSLLKRHEKIHIDVPKYICTHCDKTFLTKEYLDFHMEKHNKKRPYSCKVCNKSFVFKQGLERHEVVHSDNKPHKCNYCEASFTTAIKLTRHITTHAGLRPYPCKLCRRTFLLSHHLTRHMRSHYALQSPSKDPGIGQHKCDICSMAFRRKDSLINHSAIHSMVNLKCVICNTTFDNAQMVKQHITTHLAGLPFPCEKCDYSFETADQLEIHELKHAEMEYEEQIEKEVFSEGLMGQTEDGQDVRMAASGEMNSEEEEGEEYEDEEVYTIPIMSNPEVVPVRKHKQQQQQAQEDVEEEDIENYSGFLKNEICSEEEENEGHTESDHNTSEELLEEEPIKPIIRQEGTKMYQRKPSDKKPQLPTLDVRQSSLRETPSASPEVRVETTYGNLSPQTISNFHNKQVSPSKKVGDKTVRVQKFIVTKEEMKALAKQGILEMKGGQVVLKNAGQPILNATLKSIQKTDIESLLDKKSTSKKQIKRYQKKSQENDSLMENMPVNQ